MHPRPIVHIGLHKTATSWFQAGFYPRLTSHRYVDRVLVRTVMLGGTAWDFDPAAARAALGFDEPGPPPLICDEDLSGILHNGGILTTFLARALADRLHAVAPESQVVIFVREPSAMCAALYSQYLREGGTGSVRRYLFPEQYRHLTKVRPFKTPRFDFSQLDSISLVRHYDQLFGRENVHVFAYEAFMRERDRFLADYSARLGLAGPVPDDAGRKVNSAYRRGLMPVARFLNLFTARSVADKRLLVHVPYWYGVRKWGLALLNQSPIFGRPPSPKRLLGASTTAWIQERFAGTNRALSERLGTDLSALGYVVGDDPPTDRPRRPAWLQALRN